MKDCDTLSYWQAGGLWGNFLTNINYDHAHFIEVFRVSFSDYNCRKSIITKLCFKKSAASTLLFNNHPEYFHSTEEIFEDIENTWFTAVQTSKKAIIIFQYPAIRDTTSKESSLVTHDILIVADPIAKSILYIDSRGVDYACNAFRTWKRCYYKLLKIFAGCDWIHYNYFDIQGLFPYDNFCQTWSLILLREAIDTTTKTKFEEDEQLHSSDFDFDCVVAFWKDIYYSLPDIRERVYDEIYTKTHCAQAERVYNQYFTTLEALVTGSNSISYPKNLKYALTDHTFVVDFLTILDGQLLHKILDVAPKLQLLKHMKKSNSSSSARDRNTGSKNNNNTNNNISHSYLSVLNALSPSPDDYFVDLGKLFGVQSSSANNATPFFTNHHNLLNVGLHREVPEECLYFSLDQ